MAHLPSGHFGNGGAPARGGAIAATQPHLVATPCGPRHGVVNCQLPWSETPGNILPFRTIEPARDELLPVMGCSGDIETPITTLKGHGKLINGRCRSRTVGKASAQLAQNALTLSLCALRKPNRLPRTTRLCPTSLACQGHPTTGEGNSTPRNRALPRTFQTAKEGEPAANSSPWQRRKRTREATHTADRALPRSCWKGGMFLVRAGCAKTGTSGHGFTLQCEPGRRTLPTAASETSRLADMKTIHRPWANCTNLSRSLLFGIKLPLRPTTSEES